MSAPLPLSYRRVVAEFRIRIVGVVLGTVVEHMAPDYRSDVEGDGIVIRWHSIPIPRRDPDQRHLAEYRGQSGVAPRCKNDKRGELASQRLVRALKAESNIPELFQRCRDWYR